VALFVVEPAWLDVPVEGVSCASAKAAHNVIAALNSIAFFMSISPVQSYVLPENLDSGARSPLLRKTYIG
jgi:hypothetical protein